MLNHRNPLYGFDDEEDDFRTPDFNPHAQSQSPVTDAFESSLGQMEEDPRQGELESGAASASEAAAHQQWLQGLSHAAAQIGHGIAGAKSDIDTRAGEMFVGSAQMRAKEAQEALARYNEMKAGNIDQAAMRAGMAGQDANFRAGRQDAQTQSAHQSAALAQDQSQFEASQRQQRQMARGQGDGGITPYQQAQLDLQRERIDIEKQKAIGSGAGGMMQEVLQNPAAKQDVATMDRLAGQKNPPGTGFFTSMKDKMLPNSKSAETIQMQQAGLGMVTRLVQLESKGREPNNIAVEMKMRESGLLSGDPEEVRLGWQRIKAQLDAFERMGVRVPGGEVEQDDWQDYEPGSGQGMTR